MATKLTVFNDVLREIGSERLANETTQNTRLLELNAAFTTAVDYVLAQRDWNFSRRRFTLTGVADTSFPPYPYRYGRPADYLRKVWVKSSAGDTFQIEHAEAAAVFYGHAPSALLEYISDHASNYDPANWPPQFLRCIVIYLCALVGPRLARKGNDDVKAYMGLLSSAIAAAEGQEAVFTVADQIATVRVPVIRRAIELLRQQLAGSYLIQSKVDQLRWSMNAAFAHSTRFVLEAGAWNFATKRALFQDGAPAATYLPTLNVTGIIEGYSVPPAVETSTPPDLAGFTYGFALPEDFRHKIWIKANVSSMFECAHQRMGAYMFVNDDPCVMEYIAEDTFTTNPDNWPASFMEAIAAHLALTVAPEIVIDAAGSGSRTVSTTGFSDKLEALYQHKLSDAKLRDAMQQKPAIIPPGRFVRARGGSLSVVR